MSEIREEITRYVVGFLFSPDFTEVVLIRKNKPEWQAGKLNGVGGKCEATEFAIAAMHREFEEETGCVGADWQQFCNMEYPGGEVAFFRATGPYCKVRSMTEEIIEIHKVDEINKLPVISNLTWLIPLALDVNVFATEKYEVSVS